MTDLLSRLGSLLVYALLLGAYTLMTFALTRAISRSRNRFAPDYYPQALPDVFFLLLLLSFFLGLFFSYLAKLLRMLAATLVYSALLWALTLLLRKRISARGCAALWLLPNLIFYISLFLLLHKFTPGAPLFVVRLPRSALWIALLVWAAGFVAVLIWKLVSHRSFREAVLRDAVPVSAQERNLFLSTWRALCFDENKKRAEIENNVSPSKEVSVLRSPAVDSPLSVGLLKSWLVLPQREYSEQELRLIFRHEAIHLMHQDSRLKFTLSFLCAAGWFIPMLWPGLGKAAEDLELCCDELATNELTEEQRKNYAGLLLSNAGTAKGFTTCLSASASGLRYRMAQVLHPQKRRAGFLAVFGLSVFFFFLYGMLGVTAIGGTVQTELLDRDGGGWHVSDVMSIPDDSPATGFCSDTGICQNVEDAIRELELEKPLDHSENMGKAMIEFYLKRGDEWIRGCLYEKGLVLNEPGKEWNSDRAEKYLFSEGQKVPRRLWELVFIVDEAPEN